MLSLRNANDGQMEMLVDPLSFNLISGWFGEERLSYQRIGSHLTKKNNSYELENFDKNKKKHSDIQSSNVDFLFINSTMTGLSLRIPMWYSSGNFPIHWLS